MNYLIFDYIIYIFMTTNSNEDIKLVPIYSVKTGKVEMVEKIKKTDEEWKKNFKQRILQCGKATGY